jgi:hypothetical protein
LLDVDIRKSLVPAIASAQFDVVGFAQGWAKLIPAIAKYKNVKIILPYTFIIR